MLETEFKFGEVHDLKAQTEYSDEKVQFKSIFSNSNGGVALITMKAGQRLDEHVAPAEIMVTVLEGEIDFTVVDHVKNINTGEFILVGEGVKHQVLAKKDSKIMLVKVKA